MCFVLLSGCGTAETPSETEQSTVSTTVTTAPSVTSTTTLYQETDTTTTTTTTSSVITTTTTTHTTTTATTTTTAIPQKQWELYWSDEFEGDSLDMSKWNIESGTNGAIVKKAENVKVEDGNCVITLRRDDSTPGYEYSGAYVTTAYKFSFCYGRLEFRAKLPTGQGVWPALWTLGDNYLTIGNDEKAWPLCGEIDVMELVGSSEPQNILNNLKIMGTLHWGENRANHQQAHNSLFMRESPDADFHIYAVEWDEEKIVWYVDDKAYMRVKLDDPTMGTAFMQKHWIIMNINLNSYGGFNQYDETTPDAVGMYVDYVRVYKEKE